MYCPYTSMVYFIAFFSVLSVYIYGVFYCIVIQHLHAQHHYVHNIAYKPPIDLDFTHSSKFEFNNSKCCHSTSKYIHMVRLYIKHGYFLNVFIFSMEQTYLSCTEIAVSWHSIALIFLSHHNHNNTKNPELPSLPQAW